MKLFIGLMSGTSMDGIDAVLVDLESNTFLHGITYPYSMDISNKLQNTVLELNNFHTPKFAAIPHTATIHNLGYYSQLNTLLGKEFAEAVLNLLAGTPYLAKDIIAIGSHGQTLCHDPTAMIPYTVQMGCAHTIAEMTGITVVADFRTRDLVVGGQGAPFAPIYHQAIFKELGYPLVVVNIGGIANFSYLFNKNEVIGYDLGPGNCLMDAWIHHHLNLNYDKNGDWAARGFIIQPLLKQLLQDPYFKRKPPKSIGKEYFSLAWLDAHGLANYLQENSSDNIACDVQATLLQLTATSIADGIKEIMLKDPQYPPPQYLLICGGGAHNQTLLKGLSRLLPELLVLSTQSFNVNPDFVEALMFAWLAEKTLNGTALNLNQITGAKCPTILGVIYPAGIDKRISIRV